MADIHSCMVQAHILFEDMDEAYAALADQLGFHCQGCKDNCCRSLFYHHTLIEFLWLRSGLALLPDDQQAAIRHQAAAVRDNRIDGSRRRPTPHVPFEFRRALPDISPPPYDLSPARAPS